VKENLTSCIVPVYNGERYLGETLDSILAQTYRPIEIIVVDDGSTDGTAAVAAGYGDRVRYVWQANAGEAAARNRGLNAAEGEFIAFDDADDLWSPEKLARQMARMAERPEIDLCFTSFINFWTAELAEEQRHYQNHPLSRPQSGWSTSTLLARRAVFDKFGKFIDDRARLAGGDSMIWFLRASERGAVIDVLGDILMQRRLHAANLSRTNAVESLLPILKEWRNYQQRRNDGREK
jgi:glycosyltransferase involved in cell wall biosynthesis